MAFFAIISKFVVMNIFMAVGAFAKLEVVKLLKSFAVALRCRMTFFTSSFKVFSQEYKFCYVVVKLRSRFESVEIMAAEAIGG